MKISKAARTSPPRRTGRFLSLTILAGAVLATIGFHPALAQRDEQRFQNEQRSEDRRDERRTPPGHVRQEERRSYGYEVPRTYYEEPRYVYAPPPVVYAPPSGLEFVFPLNFR